MLSWPFSVHPAKPTALPHHLPVQNSRGSSAEHKAPREQGLEKTDGLQQRPNWLFTTQQFGAASGLPGRSKAEKTKALGEEAGPKEAANAVRIHLSRTTRAAPAPRRGLGGCLREAGLRNWRAATSPLKIPPLPGSPAWTARVWGRRQGLGQGGRR